MRILLIEDDLQLGEATQNILIQQGDSVDWVDNGISGEEAALSEEFDVVVLDIGLPRQSGLDVLQNLRKQGNKTKILLLTARDSVDDRVLGLDSGADDYLTKPFDIEELSARIRALHRRSANQANPVITYGEISLDPASHSVDYKGENIAMPRREFALLHKLLQHAGRVLSRDQLTQALYNWEDDIDSNALEVHIHNLRKKFGTKLIRTIRGVGYMIDKELPEDEGPKNISEDAIPSKSQRDVVEHS